MTGAHDSVATAVSEISGFYPITAASAATQEAKG